MTPKQARFIEEYLIDLNATQAAIRAGYAERSANVTASKLLTKANIQSAIQKAQAARSERTQITVDKVLDDIELIKLNAMQQEEDGKMINHAGALKACELQGKHLKMFVDKIEVELTDTIADRLQRAREREKDAG
jgi:phage terminase small subunit